MIFRMLPRIARVLFAGFALALPYGAPAGARESATFVTSRDTVSLVSQTNTVKPGAVIRLGLRFRLAPGWHTYWSNPGDAGAPPTLALTGANAGPIAYPAPEMLQEGGFTSYAYLGEVLLPFAATPSKGASALSLDAHATWLVCAKVCVPEEASFHLDLPAGDGAPSVEAPLFASADRHMPRSSPFPAHVGAGGELWLAAPGLSPRSARFFPAEAGLIDQGAEQALRVGEGVVEVALKPLKPGLRSITGMLSLVDASGQVENLTIDATSAPPPAGLSRLAGPRKVEPAGVGLANALLLAFAGGLVLNLMPCVLPILAMKALALSRLSGAARGDVRREVTGYTLGVVVAFCCIGGVMFALRSLGAAVGWGAQLQSAAFTTGMALLLFAVGLNLSGVFELGGQLAGRGQSFAARGAFFTGVLAVVVASPCTAPFMGAALAAALALPASAGMLIFVSLGLGLAAPYAALAVSPGLARLLPRPGAWMDVFKNLLAFPMYGAALWMVWVASQQTDPAGLAAILCGLLLTGFAAWAYGRTQMSDRPALLQGAALAALAGIFVVIAGLGLAVPQATAMARAASDGSEPFSAAKFARLRAAHHAVFVNMSASWCITCLVNERVALAPSSVVHAFADRHVAYLRGDWTRRDAGITAFLHDHDREGVPLYVYFAPDDPTGRVLPQVLTPGIVRAAVENQR